MELNENWFPFKTFSNSHTELVPLENVCEGVDLEITEKKTGLFYIFWHTNYHCNPILLCKSESILYNFDMHFILPFKSELKIIYKPEISK